MDLRVNMKKVFYVLILVLIATSMSFVMTQEKADAATYPSIYADQIEQTECVGQNVNIKYTYFPAYKNEKVIVDIYAPDGSKIATSERSFSNYTITSYDYSVKWDASKCAAGTYKAVVTMKFYSLYSWNEKPTKTTSWIELVDHSYDNATTTPATFGKSGTIVATCSRCGNALNETITAVATPKISATKYIYDGKVKNPTITVKDSNGNNLKKGTDYTITYASDKKSVGKHTATIALKGNYTGAKTLSFVINPKATEMVSVKAGKKQLTAKWKKVTSQVSGYELMYATNKAFNQNKGTKTITGNGYVTKKVTGLKAFKTYYVKVRTFKNVNGTKYYSEWSTPKVVTVLSATGPKLRTDEIKIMSGSTYTQKLFTAKGKLINASKVKFSTSNKNIATVNAKGVVTGKKPGTATITAKYNGKSYKATVVVRSMMSFSKETLTFKNKKMQKVQITVKGQMEYIAYDVVNESVATCAWGKWNGNVVTLKVTPKKIGTTKIKVYTKTAKGGKTDVKFITVKVVPAWSATCTQKFPMEVGSYSGSSNKRQYTGGTIDSLKVRIEEPYDGRGYIHLDITGTMKYRYENWSSELSFCYQVKDKDGFVVESGHVFTEAKNPGDRFKMTKTIYLDDPKGKYTVVFSDYYI